jgi:hypothetical protein
MFIDNKLNHLVYSLIADDPKVSDETIFKKLFSKFKDHKELKKKFFYTARKRVHDGIFCEGVRYSRFYKLMGSNDHP